MIRPVLTEIVLFLAPFVAYAIFLLATRMEPFDRASWPPKVVAALAIAAAVLVFGAFVILTQYSAAPPGSVYKPAHIENGKFVPGEIK
jgi:hypothetical protein